jgi:hypothetical protein
MQVDQGAKSATRVHGRGVRDYWSVMTGFLGRAYQRGAKAATVAELARNEQTIQPTTSRSQSITSYVKCCYYGLSNPGINNGSTAVDYLRQTSSSPLA